MANIAWPAKDPDEILDYQLDWKKRLVNDVITESEWDVPEGLTEQNRLSTSTTTTVWLTGGTDGETYSIVNTIKTEGGRTWVQTVKLKIQDK
jgi:hypothetical protein